MACRIKPIAFYPASEGLNRVSTMQRICFLVLLGWCLGTPCVFGQTNTNKVAQTNIPSALIQDVERLKPVTFNLDQFEALRANTFLGEPLWKYAASLIYVLLALYTAKLFDWATRVWLKRVTS